MEAVLDIYIKLLIAIISFIAPLLINLLSVFSDGIAIKKRRLSEFDAQTANLLKEEINLEGADIKKLVNDNNNTFKKRTQENNKQIDLLDPKKQIINIFPIFFYSLLFVIIYLIVSDKWFDSLIAIEWIRNLVKFLFLGISVFFAVKGVFILKNVAWAVIEVKQEIAQENEKEKQQSKSQKITSITDIVEDNK